MPLQIPHPVTPIHLYRHLLRETTYLPPICRTFVAHRIENSFQKRRHEAEPAKYVKRAHAGLRYLRSVNAGHFARLERLCLMATGRLGKRRRHLVAEYLKRPPAANTDELEAQAQARPLYGTKPVKEHDWLEDWDVDKLLVLAQSQVKAQKHYWPRETTRALDPKRVLATKNCFKQGPGPRLARNRLKRFFAPILDSLMPPVPKSEWLELQSVVQEDSRHKALRIPPRRPVARLAEEDGRPEAQSDEWDWSQHALYPSRVLEAGSSRKMKSLTGQEDQDPRGHGRAIGLKRIALPQVRRIYNRIWQMTPVMEKKAEGGGWSVTWGGGPTKLTTAPSADFFLFQGVERTGKVAGDGCAAKTPT
ncbi:hypothetical protein GGS20DRAFT_491908 [Poronia punctata]|nr:hypothetical protein GGS20DRAFT_491908 [Poronia punctata]